MEIERRQFEMSRVVNIIEEKGWHETARSVDGETMTLSVRRELKGLGPAERRMFLDDLETIVGVFGWTVLSSTTDEEEAMVSLIKTLLPKEVEPAP